MTNESVHAVGKEATKQMTESLAYIATAVGSTLGPGGRHFGFDKIGSDMRLTATFSKDGLTVLKALQYPDDPVKQAVLQYCRHASNHAVVASGDGTTSTIVLANAVAQQIQKSGAKYPQYFGRCLEQDAQKAIEAIQQEAITGDSIVKKVAMTACNHDEELADTVVDAIKRSSAFGTILVEKNAASKERYKIEKQDGYSNCKGYLYNTIFALSADENAASSKPIEWGSPYVAVFNGSLMNENQIEPFIEAWGEACKEDARNLVIVSYDIGDAVTNRLMVLNRRMAQTGLAIFAVQPRLTAEPLAGVQIERDIASFCGIPDNKILDGGNYSEMDSTFFGTCQNVKITSSTTMFLGRAENHWVEDRIQQNRSISEEAMSDFDRELAKVRNAELAEGLVKVQVGAGTHPDLQERADRFDDASRAAQSCMRAGALPGCGMSYIRAGELANVNPVLKDSFRCVFNQIMENFGIPVDLSNPGPKEGVRINTQTLDTERGDAETLGVLDACETVCAVIKNGVDLGVKIATTGGFVYRQNYEPAQ